MKYDELGLDTAPLIFTASLFAESVILIFAQSVCNAESCAIYTAREAAEVVLCIA
jgi:hypothetical protein